MEFRTFRLALIPLAIALVVGHAQEGVTVTLSEPFLIDGAGMSLYLFLNDSADTSSCYEGCEANWPPLRTDDGPVAGAELNGDLLGTTERSDGSLQVTYNGWPLYYFVGDEKPGDTNGQGRGDVWFLVSPDVEPPMTAAGDGGGDAEMLAALMTEGEVVYSNTCRECHGSRGQGRSGPELAGYQGLEDSSRVIRQVVWGGARGMPAFGDQLSDREVAAVITYVRNSFENDFGLVTEEEVADLR